MRTVRRIRSWMSVGGAAIALAAGLEAKPGEPPEPKPPVIKRPKIESRTIKFDTTSSIGLVSVRRAGAMGDTPWQKLAPAVGEVRVPEGYDLRLDLDPKHQGGLAALKPLSRHDLQMLNAAGLGLGDDDLAHIARFTSMRVLNLRRNPVGDAGMANLAGMTALETVYLDDTLVTDAGLEHLKGLKSLFHLSLADSSPRDAGSAARIGDAGVEKIAGHASLVFLNLEGSGVTDAGVRKLAALKGLYSLNLNGAPITNASLEILRESTGITELFLRGAAIDDAGAGLLGNLSGLRRLNLAGTRITGMTLAVLARLPNLAELDLSRTFSPTPHEADQMAAFQSLAVLTVHKGQLAPELAAKLKSVRQQLQIRETEG